MKNAQAYDWEVAGAHVTAVDPTVVPSQNYLSLDIVTGNCGPEQFINWNGGDTFDAATRQKNVEAIYSMLLAARLSNRPVHLWGRNSANRFDNCEVQAGYLE